MMLNKVLCGGVSGSIRGKLYNFMLCEHEMHRRVDEKATPRNLQIRCSPAHVKASRNALFELCWSESELTSWMRC